jgi:hypothetical protein
MDELPEVARVPLPRWVAPLLALTAAGLIPWTLYLTFTLPSDHVTRHYDLAWVGYDCILFCAISWTVVCAARGLPWLVPASATTGTLLVADAWFDVVTSIGTNDWIEAVLEAAFAELPLAAICAFIVWDVERFSEATFARYRRARGAARPARAGAGDARAAQRGARARRSPRA